MPITVEQAQKELRRREAEQELAARATPPEDTWDYVFSRGGSLADTLKITERTNYDAMLKEVKNPKDFEDQFTSSLYMSSITGIDPDFAWDANKQFSTYLFKEPMSPSQIVSRATQDHNLVKRYTDAWNSLVSSIEKEPTLTRWEGMVNQTAIGLANVASGGAKRMAELSLTPGQQGPFGPRYTPSEADREFAADMKEKARFMWQVGQNPDLALRNDDWLNQIMAIGAQTVPYITATTAGTIAGGPFGGFLVGDAIIGNMAYQKAIDADVPEDTANQIRFAVGITGGAIEAFGGAAADKYMSMLTEKITNRLVRAGANFTVGSLIEAAEEAGQEIADITGESIYRDIDFNDAIRRTLVAAGGGALLGGAFKTASAAVRGITAESPKSQQIRLLRLAAAQGQLTDFIVKAVEEEAETALEIVEKPAEAVAKPPTAPEAPITPEEPAVASEPTEAAPEVTEKKPWDMTDKEFEEGGWTEFETARGSAFDIEGAEQEAGAEILLPSEYKQIAKNEGEKARDLVYELNLEGVHTLDTHQTDEGVVIHIPPEYLEKAQEFIDKHGANVRTEKIGHYLTVPKVPEKAAIRAYRGDIEQRELKVSIPAPTDLEGIYFSRDKVSAQDYAAMGIEGQPKGVGFTGEYDIILKNPASEEIEQQILKEFNAPVEEDGDFRLYTPELAKEVAIELQKRGYDGVIRDASDEVIVFDVASVKSVVPEIAKKKAKEPTTLREDVTGILGGLPLEKPGLTKAEIEHLGVRGRAVLRTAQERGLKVGYKKGVADTIVNARRSMGAFVTKKKLELKNRIDALNIVKTYVPKDEQGRYMRRVVQVKSEKNITKLYTQIMDFLQKADQRQAVRDFKSFIKKAKKDYKAGQRTFGKLRVSVRDEFVKVLDEFDLAKVSEDKEKELESRLKFIQRIAGVAEKVFIEFNEDLETGLEKDATDFLVMGQRRIEETNRLSKTPIKELTAQDIRQMQGILQHLLEINNLKKDSKARRHAENLGKDIIDSRNELPKAKPEISEYTGLLGAMRWVTVEGHATISSMAGLITAKTNTVTRKVLVDNPNQANVERKVLYKSFIDHFRNLADKAGITWNDIKQLNETVQITIGGKSFEATYDDVLSIYAHTMADDNLIRILTTEGLNVYTYKPVVKGVFKKKVINEVGTPTLGELRDIAALVPSVHKKLLDMHFKTNKDIQAPAINKMSMQTENYEKAVYEKYWHVSRQFETVPEGKKTDLSVAAESWGRYRSRTGGNQRINVRPFSQEVILGMQMDAAYATMTQAMEDARTLLANRHWRRKVKDSGGRRALNELVTMFRRSQGLISDQTILDMTAANILNSAGKSILSIRPSGMGVQIASVPAAFKFVNKKYFMQAETPSKTEVKTLMESSPVLWLRWKGKQFDYALGAVGSHKAFQGMLFDHVDVTDKALVFYTWGDQIAIWKIWKAAGRQITAEQNLAEGTTEHEEATLKLLYDALETQPQWDMMHRSPITSSPSVWLRGMTMFMSARNAQYQVLLQAVDDLKKGRISQKEAAERIGSIGMAAAFVSISKRIARLAVKGAAITTLAAIGFIDSPEEKAKEEALKEAKKVPIETAFNLMGLNALGSLFVSIGYAALRRIKYGEMHYSDMRSGNMLADIMLDIVNAGELYALTAYQAMTEEKYQSGSRAGEYKALYTALAAADQTAQLIAYRFGWPYEGPKADIIWPVKAAARKTTKFKNIEAIP